MENSKENKPKGRPKKSNNKEAYKNTPFYNNLNKLFGERNESQETVATALGTTRQSFGNWLSGRNQPDYEKLVAIANYYNVSTDYLLGLSNIPCIDDKLQATCEYTGLDIFVAHQMHSSIQMNEPIAEALNFLDINKGLMIISRCIAQCQKIIDEIVELEKALKNEYPQIRTNDNGDIIVNLNDQDEISIANNSKFRKIGELEKALSFSTYELQQSIIESTFLYKKKMRSNNDKH